LECKTGTENSVPVFCGHRKAELEVPRFLFGILTDLQALAFSNLAI